MYFSNKLATWQSSGTFTFAKKKKIFFFLDIKVEVKSKSEFVWLVHVFYIWTHVWASIQNSLLAYTLYSKYLNVNFYYSFWKTESYTAQICQIPSLNNIMVPLQRTHSWSYIYNIYIYMHLIKCIWISFFSLTFKMHFIFNFFQLTMDLPAAHWECLD